jgi:hypothetical protein
MLKLMTVGACYDCLDEGSPHGESTAYTVPWAVFEPAIPAFSATVFCCMTRSFLITQFPFHWCYNPISACAWSNHEGVPKLRMNTSCTSSPPCRLHGDNGFLFLFVSWRCSKSYTWQTVGRIKQDVSPAYDNRIRRKFSVIFRLFKGSLW